VSAGDSPVWTYAVALYGRPGVAAACLGLQDSFGVDVVVLLTALYARHRRLGFTEPDLRQADVAVRDWRKDVVRRLRAVRREVKPAASEKDTDGVAQKLWRSVQAAELEAERIEFGMLDGWLAALQRGAPTLSVENCVVSLARLSFGRPLDRSQEQALQKAAGTIAAAVESCAWADD
jgi:uncharacterized protein (TIGR02444 family)